MDIIVWILATVGQAVLIALSLRWIALARRAWRKRQFTQPRAP